MLPPLRSSVPGPALALALVALALVLPASSRGAVDLDVAVPPGSPLDWARAFPAITPGSGPLFPTSGPRADDEKVEQRSSSQSAGRLFDVQSSSAFGLVRILTWDLAAHLTWVQTMPPPPGSPRTGQAGFHPPLPQAGEALYWMTLAPLLRLMLHPAAVSRAEVIAHLVEIGEPTLAILPAAAGEQALAGATLDIEVLIRTGHDEAPSPIAKEDPIAAMRSRFVFDELSTRFAHDPVAGFGERLFLLGEEMLPEVAEYVDAENAFVRRNAVAALSRYRSPEAGRVLLGVATTTKDPVCLLRALSGLGRIYGRLDTSGLVRRLETTDDPVLACALIAAVGRARLEQAASRLMSLGERALASTPRDTDLLGAVLASFAEMRPRTERAAVLAFVKRVEADTVKKSRDYRRDDPQAVAAPDNFDPPELRAEIVRQLAMVLSVRLDPGGKDARRKLLELRTPIGPGPINAAFLPVRTNDTLGNIHPPVRFLYLATLAECGEKGTEALIEVALDRRSEASIRGYALAQAPFNEGAAAAAQILRDPAESVEMKIQAFEVANLLKHPELRELGLAILAATAALEPGEGTAAERYLGLTAVRTLSRQKRVGVRELMPLLKHVKSERSAHDRVPDEIFELATVLVKKAALGAQRVALEETLDALLDLAIGSKINADLTDRTRAGVKKDVFVLISDAKAHRTNSEYLRLVAVAVAERLLGFPLERENRAQGEFLPRVMLEEEILLALGRCGEPMAIELLLNVLANTQNRHRAAACLALGMVGRKGAEETLARFLADGDPWVRFTAAMSLAHLTGDEPKVDWMYAAPATRLAAAEAWRRRLDGDR